jgi:hypothetical protein
VIAIAILHPSICQFEMLFWFIFTHFHVFHSMETKPQDTSSSSSINNMGMAGMGLGSGGGGGMMKEEMAPKGAWVAQVETLAAPSPPVPMWASPQFLFNGKSCNSK